jgi:hypothetical protein
MPWTPDALRRIVTVSGLLGVLLMVVGYWAIQQQAAATRIPGLLGFYGGVVLVIAAIVVWYRHVPPRPRPSEEPEEPEQFEHLEDE